MIGGAVILAGGIIWTIVHYATGNKESPSAARFIPTIAPTLVGHGVRSFLAWALPPIRSKSLFVLSAKRFRLRLRLAVHAAHRAAVCASSAPTA